MKKQKGTKLGGCSQLTNTQREVLRLLTQEYLIPPKVANIRGTTLKAVYKTIKILEKKGIYNHKTKKVQNADHTPPNKNTQKIRLHGQHFTINLLKKSNEYEKIKEKSNMFKIDDNTIKLHNTSIEVYSNNSFMGSTTKEATENSLKYWYRLFMRLEHDLKILIVKDRATNIKLVQNHYAETNNELAKDLNKKKEYIRIYAREDGKMWFEIDNSFNLNEAETTHPQTAEKDMRNIIQPFFNDLRNNKVLLPSELNEALLTTQKQINEIGAGLNTVIKLITPHEQPKTEDIEKKYILDYIG